MSERRAPGIDEFFIGWLAMPTGYARLLRVVTPALLLAAAGVAAILPLWQQSPGTGAWDSDEVVTVEGILQAEPYAMLHGASLERTILLVEAGKFGAASRARPLAGRFVRATGTFLHREGRWMLELSADETALQAVERPETAAPVWPKSQPAGRSIVLTGEVIDPKCYLGGMRPGGGKTHKACAMLCISGGIPPMLAVRQNDRETFYLLTLADGSAANAHVLPFVGDLVEVQGERTLVGELPVLRMSNIHRR
jgi:hypothetical protein